MNVKHLMEQRATAIKAARDLNDLAVKEGRKLTAEEQPKYDAADADVARLTEAIEREQRLVRAEATLLEVPGSEPVRKTESAAKVNGDEALRTAVRVMAGFDVSDEERANMKAAGFTPGSHGIDLRLARRAPKTIAEARDLSATSASSGGATVAEGFVRQLEVSLLAFGNVRGVAQVIRTTEGNALPWPTMNDTANSGALLAENTTISTSVDPTFGSVTFDAYKYSSKPIVVPNELLQDSAFDLSSYIAAALGERIGRAQNAHFTTGDGSSKPRGIVTASSAGKTTGVATTITMDELVDLYHSVDIAYRNGAAWMMNDGIAAYLRKLKDGAANYLWQPSIVAGRPDMLLGAPVHINNDMAATVTTAYKTVIFGQLSKYTIRDAGAVRLVRMNERYADLDQTAFVAFLRSDGDMLDAGTDPVKHLLQA